MSEFGDSLLVINDDEIVKVHVHTEYPGQVFNYGQQYGELIKLKVENMREQHREVIRKEETIINTKHLKQLKQQLLLYLWVTASQNYLNRWVQLISLVVVKQ